MLFHRALLMGIAIAALVSALLAAPVIRADDNEGVSFEAELSGAQEVPMTATEATGEATFVLSADGTSIHFVLEVEDINNVIAAHIHLGAPGVNGPVVAFLYGPTAPGGGPIEGKIASGTITAANLVGPLAGHPLSDLVAAMNSGNTYANVHTNDGVNPINTGPGDFPAGEIRGQIVFEDED